MPKVARCEARIAQPSWATHRIRIGKDRIKVCCEGSGSLESALDPHSSISNPRILTAWTPSHQRPGPAS